MKRNDGKELIVTRWEVVTTLGQSDAEVVIQHKDKDAALVEYGNRLVDVLATEYSDVRLYACDKQGYMECVKMAIHAKGGKVWHDDKMDQL